MIRTFTLTCNRLANTVFTCPSRSSAVAGRISRQSVSIGHIGDRQRYTEFSTMGKRKPGTPAEPGSAKSAFRHRRPKPKNADIASLVSGSQNISTTSVVEQGQNEPVEEDNSAFSGMPSYETLRGKIDQRVLDTILHDLKFDKMSAIQAAAIEPLLEKRDMLGQARTGTGKTLAFLIPAIETLLRSPPQSDKISALIISPTRELVQQIAAEAEKLLGRLPNIKVRTAIGGTKKDKEGRSIYNGGCQVLVATPGRLLDHLSDEHMRYKLSKVQTLILDEADRMLDMGFIADIKAIIASLPQKQQVPRQSILFSATVPQSIIGIAKTILSPNYISVSTIPEGEANTHERVKQYLITVPNMMDLTPALLSVVKTELARAETEFKCIVFAPTAVLSDLYSHVLSELVSGIPVLTLHSRLSQPKRTATTNDFRKASRAICIATDVIARGMDFPLVTHVFQVGLPMNRESYIHRLGRTARADASGVGFLLLAEPEKTFASRDLRDISFLTPDYATSTSLYDVQPAIESLELEKRGKIYAGFLGYYKAMKKYTKWENEALVEQANIFAKAGLLCPETPALEASTVGKMGLRGTKGLHVVPNRPRPQGGGQRPRR